MNKGIQQLPVGHVLVPASAIGALSILLVVGLSALGILAQVNWVIANIVSNGNFLSYPKTLAEWVIWLAAFTFAFWLSFTLLSVAGTWRRVVLWVTAVTLVAAWAPVLSLAAHAPNIGAPLIATFWAGICALIYASRHQMACDHRQS